MVSTALRLVSVCVCMHKINQFNEVPHAISTSFLQLTGLLEIELFIEAVMIACEIDLIGHAVNW